MELQPHLLAHMCVYLSPWEIFINKAPSPHRTNSQKDTRKTLLALLKNNLTVSQCFLSSVYFLKVCVRNKNKASKQTKEKQQKKLKALWDE